ncbi:MAG TPA: tRNA (adenosine(37)-N6)-threonylcarbamoyltransferase complex dimerization subunit type 1 TsaB, partial [bacterium]|nr:tRNA (adenosine(37)-N6)-threonylcarbamoyltransferase complex dimerization subunit type 1 TsaB [bacterium]
MRILAIETATLLGGIAILESERLVRFIEEEVPRRHLEWLAPAIRRLLNEADLSPSDVEAVAVSVGPGGFTSLRIGIATAVAWGRGRGVPVVGVSTLAALAAGVEPNGYICPMLDARRGEVAAAVFLTNGAEFKQVLGEIVAPLDQILEQLPQRESITFAGDALARYEGEVISRLGGRATIAPR